MGKHPHSPVHDRLNQALMSRPYVVGISLPSCVSWKLSLLCLHQCMTFVVFVQLPVCLLPVFLLNRMTHRCRELARRRGIPTQEFCVKSDMACGSTIGPILSSGLGCRTVDVGGPQLSMHSIREMCGTKVRVPPNS